MTFFKHALCSNIHFKYPGQQLQLAGWHHLVPFTILLLPDVLMCVSVERRPKGAWGVEKDRKDLTRSPPECSLTRLTSDSRGAEINKSLKANSTPVSDAWNTPSRREGHSIAWALGMPLLAFEMHHVYFFGWQWSSRWNPNSDGLRQHACWHGALKQLKGNNSDLLCYYRPSTEHTGTCVSGHWKHSGKLKLLYEITFSFASHTQAILPVFSFMLTLSKWVYSVVTSCFSLVDCTNT